jgi:hypothetical protein
MKKQFVGVAALEFSRDLFLLLEGGYICHFFKWEHVNLLSSLDIFAAQWQLSNGKCWSHATRIWAPLQWLHIRRL